MPCIICDPPRKDPGTTYYYCDRCLVNASLCRHDLDADGRCRKCGFFREAYKEILKET